MQNTYFSSSMYSVRTQGSLSYSFNDFSYLLNERFDRNPIHSSTLSSSKSCCCTCCAFSTHRVPINPCYLYGLRQSTLLQWSACRRLILGCRDRYNYRVQEQRPDWGCDELPCSLMERSVYSRRGRRRNGRCCTADGEGEGELYNSGDLDDAEAMLSLLSEEVGECFRRERNGFSFKVVELEGRRRLSGRERNVSSSKRVEEESTRSLSVSERKVNSSKRVEEESRRSLSGRERNAISSKRVEEESRRSLSGSERNVNSSKRLEVESKRSLSGRERNAISSKRVEAERRSFGGREKNGISSKGVQVEIEGNNSSECNSGKKKNDGRLSSSESNSKRQFESATIDLSEGDSRQKEERGMFLRSENLKERKGGSSSSYYSFSSSGDFEDKHGLLEEPASSVYKDSECDRFDEQVSEEYRKHRDDSDGNGEITRQTNTAVEGGVMWDWRKKTEKKLTEVVAEETQADWKSSEMHSRVMKTKQHELGKASGSHKQFDDKQETSYLTERTKEQYSQTESQVGGVPESRRKFQEHNEISESRRNAVETTSWSQKRPTQREENLGIATNLVQETKGEHYKTAGNINQKEDLNRDNQKLSRVSQVRVADAERTSNWQGQSDTRRIYQEENTNVLLSSVNQIQMQHHQIDQQIIGRVNLGRKAQQVTDISEICDSGVETANIIQPEIRIKNQAERSNLVPASSRESSDPYSGMDEKAFQGIQSIKGTDDVTEMPLVCARNKERNTNAQRISKKRTINQGSDIALAATSFEETRQRNKETDETLMQVKPRKEAQSSTGLSNFYETDSEGASSFQASLSMVSHARIQPHDVVGNKRSPQAMPLPPPSQLIARGSPHIKSTSGMATREVSGEISESSSPALCTHYSGKQTSALHQESYTGSGNAETEAEIEYLIPEDALGSAYRLEKSSSQFLGDFIESVRYGVSTSENQDETVSEPRLVYGGEEDGQSTSALLQESGSGNGNPGTPGEILCIINPEDALNSAHRLEKSSSQFVGEFSEKVRHEVSTSKNQNVNIVSEEKLVHGDEKYGQRNSSQNGSEDLQKKENDSRRSSGGSGTKGPSDEIWDATDPSVLRTPMAEKSEVTTSGNAIVKRTGRSVWNIVADILRLRWSSNAETPRSAGKSGGRISSNESASSEAWFSGREPEDNNEKNAKRDQDMQPEPTSDQLQPGKSFSQSEGVSVIMRTKDKVRYPEAGTPSSPIKDDSGLTSKAVSVSSGEETLGSKENQKSSQGSSSGIKKVESSQPLVASGVRSPVVEEISNPGITVSASGSTTHMDQFGSQKLNEVSDNVQLGGELKQRKLQRNKQVLRDRFDEWEDAYTLEIEQRKTDEMFMREALLEAKKAADTWEMPVGAVVVQHGKIIARGCNLVEELRDSTAHAEMICIREASNLLRTWRLVDSTLYVTLEPCPMCAGAILQARIDTVVWGAPNKLLGADGSWIRLFPDGRGGNGSEQSDKPAAPVHPFHPKMNIRRGVLATECADIMKQFFQLRRKKKEKQADPPAPPARQPVSHHPSKLLTKMHDIFHIMFCL